jgi:hypothetical protein
MYVLMWSAITGRRLASESRPDMLSEQELVNFWADDLVSAAGRHARPTADKEAAS